MENELSFFCLREQNIIIMFQKKKKKIDYILSVFNHNDKNIESFSDKPIAICERSPYSSWYW